MNSMINAAKVVREKAGLQTMENEMQAILGHTKREAQPSVLVSEIIIIGID